MTNSYPFYPLFSLPLITYDSLITYVFVDTPYTGITSDFMTQLIRPADITLNT